MIIATLLEPDLEQIKAAMDDLANVADAYEIRFDACNARVEPEKVRGFTTKPLVGTVRRVADGGHYTGDEHQRLELLEECLRAGFEFIDVEGPTTVPGPEERMIRSRHELRATPSLGTIHRMAEEIQRNGATFKFAAKTQSFADTMVLLSACRALHRTGKPFAIMGLGDFPRVLTHLLGSRLVYGGGRTNAPGQPPARDLAQTHQHWGRPGPHGELYLVVGEPVAHSLSPRMHNAAFRHDGLDKAYGALRVASGLELQMLLARRADLGLRGLSITTPLKDAGFDLVTERTPEAERARAVNTIKFDDDRVIGHNTDGLGARTIIQRLSKGKRVLVAGTGGAGRAIAAALEGFDVTLAGRNGEALRNLQQRLGVTTAAISSVTVDLDAFDVIVNATRVPEPFKVNNYGGAVFDLRYADEATPWERAARESKAAFAGGRTLLLEQGLLAYEFWTGRSAPRPEMAAALGVPA